MQRIAPQSCTTYVHRIVLTLPLHMRSEANERSFWGDKSSRVREHRSITRAALNRYSVAKSGFTRVVFTRLGPRMLDSDNLAGSFKAVRDEIAAYCGVDDGPTGPIMWECQQEKSAAYGLRVELLA
jgi:hypothetical protein